MVFRMEFKGKKVLITGGASGIGKALVLDLIQKGCYIGIFDIDRNACNEISKDFDGKVKIWTPDISDPAAVDKSCIDAFESGFCPDILINNAGIIHSEPLVNFMKSGDKVHSRETWRKTIATDLDSVFYVTGRVVENMIKRRIKGIVVSISSISSRGNAGQSAYSAAKAGVNALTLTWAKELGPLGLRFVAISPGFINTDSTKRSLNENQINKIKKLIPLGHLGNPDSIIEAVNFVISNDYINGTILEVDGGMIL